MKKRIIACLVVMLTFGFVQTGRSSGEGCHKAARSRIIRIGEQPKRLKYTMSKISGQTKKLKYMRSNNNKIIRIGQVSGRVIKIGE